MKSKAWFTCNHHFHPTTIPSQVFSTSVINCILDLFPELLFTWSLVICSCRENMKRRETLDLWQRPSRNAACLLTQNWQQLWAVILIREIAGGEKRQHFSALHYCPLRTAEEWGPSWPLTLQYLVGHDVCVSDQNGKPSGWEVKFQSTKKLFYPSRKRLDLKKT